MDQLNRSLQDLVLILQDLIFSSVPEYISMTLPKFHIVTFKVIVTDYHNIGNFHKYIFFYRHDGNFRYLSENVSLCHLQQNCCRTYYHYLNRLINRFWLVKIIHYLTQLIVSSNIFLLKRVHVCMEKAYDEHCKQKLWSFNFNYHCF